MSLSEYNRPPGFVKAQRRPTPPNKEDGSAVPGARPQTQAAALARAGRSCYTGIGMPRDGEEERLARLRQTRFLVIGGVVCLLLPLAAVLYLKLSDSGP